MKFKPSQSLVYKILLALAAGLLINASPALAGPGAHGPNGEHLSADTSPHDDADVDAPSPRLEAQSDVFEVVGQLSLPHTEQETGELSLLIDRFETNEPVLKAKVEVALGELKAMATFHEDHGDYAITDKALLAQLRQAGPHPLVITIESGEDADLLDAKLVTPDEHDHDTAPQGSWRTAGVLGTVAALLMLVVIVWVARQVWTRKREGVAA